MSLGGLFNNAPSAPYPTTGYPASAFFGAVALQPGGNGTADTPKLNPKDTKTLVITVGALILGGYVAWHLYYR